MKKFKYPKVFQCDNGSEFKSLMQNLLEEHNSDIWRTTTKYKHTHRAFVEAFNKSLVKQLFKSMDVQGPTKYQKFVLKLLTALSTRWATQNYRWKAQSQTNDLIKLGIVKLDKSYLKKNLKPEDDLNKFL